MARPWRPARRGARLGARWRTSSPAAPGFIGRNLIARLLERRDGDIYVLVRKGSTGRLRELTDHYWPGMLGASATPAGLGVGASG